MYIFIFIKKNTYIYIYSYMYICNHVYIHPTRRDFVLWISIHFFWGNMWHSSQTRNLPGTTKTIVQWPFNLRKHIPNWSELDRYPIGKNVIIFGPHVRYVHTYQLAPPVANFQQCNGPGHRLWLPNAMSRERSGQD